VYMIVGFLYITVAQGGYRSGYNLREVDQVGVKQEAEQVSEQVAEQVAGQVVLRTRKGSRPEARQLGCTENR
jgi:hypothetical protein